MRRKTMSLNLLFAEDKADVSELETKIPTSICRKCTPTVPCSCLCRETQAHRYGRCKIGHGHNGKRIEAKLDAIINKTEQEKR